MNPQRIHVLSLALILGLALGPIGFARGAEVVQVLPVGGGPHNSVVTPDGSKLYLAEGFSSDVAVIDLRTLPARVLGYLPVGSQPVGVAMDAAGGRVYVSNRLAGTVSVIDPVLDEVVSEIAVGRYPCEIHLEPGGRYLYVAAEGSNRYQRIDLETLAVDTFLYIYPYIPQSFSFSPDGRFGYFGAVTITNGSPHTYIVDLATGAVAGTIDGFVPAVTWARGGGRVILRNQYADPNRIALFDVADPQAPAPVWTAVTDPRPNGVALDPEETTFLLTNDFSDEISLVDPADGRLLEQVPVGAWPSGISIHPSGRYAYAGNLHSDTLSVIRLNQAPRADAGADRSVTVGSPVTLDGSGSFDPDGDDPLSCQWTLVSRPAGSQALLTGGTGVSPSFVPDLPGDYRVELAVTDALGKRSEPDTVAIHAVSCLDELVQTLQETIVVIGGLDPGVFKPGQPAGALVNKLEAVLDLVAQGRYAEARDKLRHDLLPKTDGCALHGRPDRPDWIQDCPAQEQVSPLIVEAIEWLDCLL